jgi:hypothetical protein
MKKLLAVLLAGLCASAAMAAPDHHRETVTTVLPGVNLVIGDHDRSYYRHHREDRNYGYRDERRGCPPGLAKKHNGCMPPGQAKRYGHDRDHYGYRNDYRRDHDRYGYRDDRHERVARW